MLKPKVSHGASLLPHIFVFINFLLVFSLVSGKVENSFQSSQYSQYKDYYSSTPTYQYPDLTVKSASAGDISNSPVLGDLHQQQDPLLGQGTAQQPVVQGAPNQHVYYYETYPMQDTSRGNLYNVPGGNKRCTYMGNGNMRCYSRQDSGYGVTDYDTTGGDEGSGAGLGGLAGLIGLLGLKGLKGLASVVFPAILPLLFPLLLPLLLPVLLPLLLLLLVPLLLLPIPVVSVPGRSLEEDFSEARKMAAGVFERVVSSGECIERISCEISKMSQKRKAGVWIEKALHFLPESSPITKRIFKGISMVNGTSTDVEGKSDRQSCRKLSCEMLNVFAPPSG